MKKKIDKKLAAMLGAVVTGSCIVGFIAGGITATEIHMKQNRDIWIGVLELIDRLGVEPKA